MMIDTPYPLNSPEQVPVRKYPMSINDLLRGNEYLKRLVDSCTSIDHCNFMLDMISMWLGNIEIQNHIVPRLRFFDDVEFFFRGRLKERRRYLTLCTLVCQELQDTLTQKMSEFIDEDGEIKKVEPAKVMGFRH